MKPLMQLEKPPLYQPDPGRSLTKEEREAVAETITPIKEIKSRTCKREGNNDIYRLGRK